MSKSNRELAEKIVVAAWSRAPHLELESYLVNLITEALDAKDAIITADLLEAQGYIEEQDLKIKRLERAEYTRAGIKQAESAQSIPEQVYPSEEESQHACDLWIINRGALLEDIATARVVWAACYRWLMAARGRG